MDIIITQPLYLGIAIALAIAIAVINYAIALNRAKSVDRLLARGSGQSLWELTDSGRSSYFFDVDIVSSAPSPDVRYITTWFVQKINEVKRKVGHIDYIAFIEKDSGPIGILSQKDLLVSKTQIPAIIVRVRRRLARAAIKGDFSLGRGLPIIDKTIVIISDVATSGSQIEKAVNPLRRYGANTPYAIVLLDRERGAGQTLKDIGVELISLRKHSYLEAKGLVPSQVPVSFEQVQLDSSEYRDD